MQKPSIFRSAPRVGWALLSLFASLSVAAQTSAPRVFFVEPLDGAVVTSPVVVKFSVEGMRIGSLGDMSPGLGHHHVLINGKAIATGQAIPFDEQHVHFGGGQTEGKLNLAPGDYTLTLQFGNGAHQSYGPPLSQTIKIRVKASPQ